MQDLMSRMESSLEAVALRGSPVKKYSSRHHLRKDMVGNHPIFSLFVSGASNGSASHFHCMICKRDVSMLSRGAREFVRHYSGDRHWSRDVAYRVQQGLPVFDQLMKPLELTSEERAAYLEQDVVDKDEGFSFPEDLLPACTRVDSTIPLLTMVTVSQSCVGGVAATLCCVNCGAIFVLLWGVTIPCTASVGIVLRHWLVIFILMNLFSSLLFFSFSLSLMDVSCSACKSCVAAD